MGKTTPTNCKEPICKWNAISPGENSQECIGCSGNKDPEWTPIRER